MGGIGGVGDKSHDNGVEERQEYSAKERAGLSMRARMLVCGSLLFGLVAISTALGVIYLAGQEPATEGQVSRGMGLVVTGSDSRIDQSVVRMLEVYGTSYRTVDVGELGRDILYDQDGVLRFSVVIVNDNQFTPGQAVVLLDAVANHSLGLVVHTSSLDYLAEALRLETVQGGEWENRLYWGDFSIEDADHHITNIMYDPMEHQTHNLGYYQPTEASYFQAAQTANDFGGEILAKALMRGPQYPETSQIFPEIVATKIGMGRVVWFARPFWAYEETSYYFVEGDRSLSLLIPRAAEWASGLPMASKWMYSQGRWSAYIPVLDGYYTSPSADYPLSELGNLTSIQGSGTSLIDAYAITESILIRQDIVGTLGLTLHRQDDQYDLAELGPCLDHIDQLLQKGFEIGLTANRYQNYDGQDPLAVSLDLGQGREEIARLFPSAKLDLLPFLPGSGGDSGVVSDATQQAAWDAGFKVCSGGVVKQDFPYDFYGSFYPFYHEHPEEPVSSSLLVIEYNEFFDQITSEVDTYYYKYIHDRAGCAVVVIRPWAIQLRPDVQALLENQIIEAKQYGDVWFATMPSVAQYWSARREVSLETATTLRGVSLEVCNRGGEIKGFTVNLALGHLEEHRSIDTAGLRCSTDSGTQIGPVGQIFRDDSVFVWFDLPAQAMVTLTLPYAS